MKRLLLFCLLLLPAPPVQAAEQLKSLWRSLNNSHVFWLMVGAGAFKLLTTKSDTPPAAGNAGPGALAAPNAALGAGAGAANADQPLNIVNEDGLPIAPAAQNGAGLGLMGRMNADRVQALALEPLLPLIMDRVPDAIPHANKDRDTALHLAIRDNDLVGNAKYNRIIRVINAGINPYAKNLFDETAADIAHLRNVRTGQYATPVYANILNIMTQAAHMYENNRDRVTQDLVPFINQAGKGGNPVTIVVEYTFSPNEERFMLFSPVRGAGNAAADLDPDPAEELA